MSRILNKIKKDELIRGSIILFILINLCNAINYLFHASLARLLGPADYGTFTVLFSLMYIFAISSEAIQNVISSYTSKLNINKESGKIKYLFSRSFKKSIKISLVCYIIYIPIAFFLHNYLDIDLLLFLITGIFIFLFFFIPIIRGTMQGMKRFYSLGFNMFFESLMKLILGIFLVLIGFKVYGAIFATLIGALFSIFIALPSLKKILRSKQEWSDFKGIYYYSIPYFISIFTIVMIYSLDVIFAKKFFDATTAGLYSAVSTLGKVIFFSIFGISKAMFPLSSENHASGKKSTKIIIKSLKLAFIISLIILLIYLLFPRLILTILFGKEYVEAYKIVFIVGLSLAFLSFTNLLLLYGLAVNKIKKSAYFLLGFIVMEIVLFYNYHANIIEFSKAFLVINLLLLMFSIILVKR